MARLAKRRPLALLFATALFFLVLTVPASSEPATGVGNDFLAQLGQGGGRASYGLYAIALLTVFSLAPAILVMVTSFTRIVIVLHFLRHAIGVQNVPPNQVLMGLAIFLTLFSMGGVVDEVRVTAINPLIDGQMGPKESVLKAYQPLRAFMLRQARKDDLALLYGVSSQPPPDGPEAIPFSVLIPAFVLGELRVAFQIGLLLFLPFLVIDLVVAVVLASSGLNLLSPAAVSLPFKVLLFVLIDGWSLVVGSLLRSFVL